MVELPVPPVYTAVPTASMVPPLIFNVPVVHIPYCVATSDDMLLTIPPFIFNVPDELIAYGVYEVDISSAEASFATIPEFILTVPVLLIA